MSQETAWKPRLAQRTLSGWQVHVYVTGGRSLCQLSAISAAEAVDEAGEVAACGPCMVAAGVLANLARQVLHGSAAPAQTPIESADVLAEGPFGEITRPDAIREWVKGANYATLPPRPVDDWTTITEGGR